MERILRKGSVASVGAWEGGVPSTPWLGPLAYTRVCLEWETSQEGGGAEGPGRYLNKYFLSSDTTFKVT